MIDLEEAILLHRETLSLRPPSHPYYSDSLYSVANSLQNRLGRQAQ